MNTVIQSIEQWYLNQEAIHWKITPDKKGRNTRMLASSKEIGTMDEGFSDLQDQLAQMKYADTGRYYIQTFNSPEKSGTVITEYRFQLQVNDIKQIKDFYNIGKSPFPAVYNHQGQFIGTTGQNMMGTMNPMILQLMNEVSGLKQQLVQVEKDNQIARLEESIEAIAESQTKPWEKILDILQQPQSLQAIAGIFGVGGRAGIQGIPEEEEENEEEDVDFSEEEMHRIIRSANTLQGKIEGHRVADFIEKISAMPAETLKIYLQSIK